MYMYQTSVKRLTENLTNSFPFLSSSQDTPSISSATIWSLAASVCFPLTNLQKHHKLLLLSTDPVQAVLHVCVYSFYKLLHNGTSTLLQCGTKYNNEAHNSMQVWSSISPQPSAQPHLNWLGPKETNTTTRTSTIMKKHVFWLSIVEHDSSSHSHEVTCAWLLTQHWPASHMMSRLFSVLFKSKLEAQFFCMLAFLKACKVYKHVLSHYTSFWSWIDLASQNNTVALDKSHVGNV